MLAGTDVDAFLHFWGDDPEEVHDLAAKHVGAFANIRACVVEPQRPFDTEPYKSNIHPGSNAFNIQSMLCGIYEANKLKSAYEATHGRYDCVIRTRADVGALGRVDLQHYRNMMGFFCVPDICYYAPGLNDTFAFSSSENMDQAAALFEKIDDYFNAGVPLNPHTMLLHHAHQCKIPVAYISMPVELVREASP